MEKAFQFPKLQEQFQERGIGARPVAPSPDRFPLVLVYISKHILCFTQIKTVRQLFTCSCS